MNTETIQYALIRVTPDARRGEMVNVGLVVFLPGRLDVRMLASLHKLRAIDPRIDQDMLHGYQEAFANLAAALDTPEQRHQVLRDFGNVTLSDLGWFQCTGQDDYERQVDAIMDALVTPPARPRRPAPASRLETDIKDHFRRQHLLGACVDDIDRHKIVAKYPLGDAGKLSVDFALRNGHWHVTETIDFKGSAETLRGAKFQQAAVKSITLDTAERKLAGKVTRLVVYQAHSDEVLELVQPSIGLLSDYAERLYNYADAADRSAYFDRIAHAAGQLVPAVRLN